MHASECQHFFCAPVSVNVSVSLLFERIKGEFTLIKDADAQCKLQVLKKKNRKTNF